MVVPSAPSKRQQQPPLRQRGGDGAMLLLFSKRQLVIASTLVGVLSSILTVAVVMVYLNHTVSKAEGNSTLYGNRLILPVDKPYRKPISHPKYDKIYPKVAWLISFPNSGTSFTLRYIRRATNTTTATNYALEGEVKDQPSVPIHPDLEDEGPWLERNLEYPTRNPDKYIITKTHCEGICSNCVAPNRFLFTPKSFRIECQGGSKAVWKDDTNKTSGVVKKKDVYYHEAQVKKAIHLFRHPLDNIVARYHLVWKREVRELGNDDFAIQYPYNATGFRAWCRDHDKMTAEVTSTWFERALGYATELQTFGEDFLCLQEFYQYVQWHNFAFDATNELNIPTLIIYYEDYSDNFDLASARILDFLELEEVEDSEEVAFIGGKSYRDYYTPDEREAVKQFIEQTASDATWERLQYYYQD